VDRRRRLLDSRFVRPVGRRLWRSEAVSPFSSPPGGRGACGVLPETNPTTCQAADVNRSDSAKIERVKNNPTEGRGSRRGKDMRGEKDEKVQTIWIERQRGCFGNRDLRRDHEQAGNGDQGKKTATRQPPARVSTKKNVGQGSI